eukprot:TRINITY_DN4010_c1_g1_i2.p1 TRINITY_DN4010_c1_g1~~TRINITY_DN4010_c1_g1_i2.p1  ORF type:complete len:2494 (+),score=738.78 TRINITY_DN4010_c1_g1_i2:84-7484(+)
MATVRPGSGRMLSPPRSQAKPSPGYSDPLAELALEPGGTASGSPSRQGSPGSTARLLVPPLAVGALRSRPGGADEAAVSAERRRVRAAALASPRVGSARRDAGLAAELERVRRAAKARRAEQGIPAASPPTPQPSSPPSTSPPRRPVAAPRSAPTPATGTGTPRTPPTVGASGTPPAADPVNPMGQLERAISGREARTQRLLIEKDTRLAQQAARLSELETKMRELRDAHAGQIAALQAQLAVQTRPSSPVSQGPSRTVRAEAAEALAARLERAEARARAAEAARDEAAAEVCELHDRLQRVSQKAERESAERHRDELAMHSREGALGVRLVRERDEAMRLRGDLHRSEGELEGAAGAAAQLRQELAAARRDAEAEAALRREERERAREGLQRERCTAADLREQLQRQQGRCAALEARVLELELAHGQVQEEAAAEQRLRCAAELDQAQELWREQARADAEELGRLRGQLSAAEARVELSDSRFAALEQQLAAAREQAEEARQLRNAAVAQSDFHGAQLDQSGARVQQLERSLAESRAALGRQAGQLQAAQERAAAHDGQLAELQRRVERAEREAARSAAEAAEGRAAAERLTADLHTAAIDRAAAEDRLRTQSAAAAEADAEARSLAAQRDAARTMQLQAEERACALEAAMSAQGSALRQQLQADADAAAAQRVMRERAAWEASTLELDSELQTACRRRRSQAGCGAAALEKAAAQVRRAVCYAAWRRHADSARADRYARQGRVDNEAVEAAHRRELQLEEDIHDAARLAEESRARLFRHRLRAAEAAQRSARAAVARAAYERLRGLRELRSWERGLQAAADEVDGAWQRRADALHEELERQGALLRRARRRKGSEAALSVAGRLRLLWRGFGAWTRWHSARRAHSAAASEADQVVRRRHAAASAVSALAAAAGARLRRASWQRLAGLRGERRCARAAASRLRSRATARGAAAVVCRQQDTALARRALLRWLGATNRRLCAAGLVSEEDWRRRRLRLGGNAVSALAVRVAVQQQRAAWAKWCLWYGGRAAGGRGCELRRRGRLRGLAAGLLCRSHDDAMRRAIFAVWARWVSPRPRSAPGGGGGTRFAALRRAAARAAGSAAVLRPAACAWRKWLLWCAEARAASAGVVAREANFRRVRLAQRAVAALAGRARVRTAWRALLRWCTWWARVRAEAAGCSQEAMKGLQRWLCERAMEQMAGSMQRQLLQRCFSSLRRLRGERHLREYGASAVELSLHVEQANASMALVAQQSQGRVSRTKGSAADACGRAVDLLQRTVAFGAWLRWLCLRHVLRAEAGAEQQQKAAAVERIEADARIQELEGALEDLAAKHKDSVSRCEEACVENASLADRVEALDKGLADAREALSAHAEEYVAKSIRAEAQRDELRGELERSVEEARKWKGEAQLGVRQAEELFRSKALVMEDEAQRLAQREADARAIGERLRAEVAELRDARERERIELASQLEQAYASREREREQREGLAHALAQREGELAALDSALAAARGELREVESQWDARAQDHAAARAHSEGAAAALAAETERRQALERALADAQRVYEERSGALADELVALQERTAGQGEALREALQRAAFFEEQAAALRGHLKQTTRNREILGPLAEQAPRGSASPSRDSARREPEGAGGAELAAARADVAALRQQLHEQRAARQQPDGAPPRRSASGQAQEDGHMHDSVRAETRAKEEHRRVELRDQRIRELEAELALARESLRHHPGQEPHIAGEVIALQRQLRQAQERTAELERELGHCRSGLLSSFADGSAADRQESALHDSVRAETRAKEEHRRVELRDQRIRELETELALARESLKHRAKAEPNLGGEMIALQRKLKKALERVAALEQELQTQRVDLELAHEEELLRSISSKQEDDRQVQELREQERSMRAELANKEAELSDARRRIEELTERSQDEQQLQAMRETLRAEHRAEMERKEAELLEARSRLEELAGHAQIPAGRSESADFRALEAQNRARLAEYMREECAEEELGGSPQAAGQAGEAARAPGSEDVMSLGSGPGSPPSPLGRRHQRRPADDDDGDALPPTAPSPRLSAGAAPAAAGAEHGLDKVEWIFRFADSDGDGFLSFEELSLLSRRTNGSCDQQQYQRLLEHLGAPPQGLRVDHLRRLYAELGRPGDVEDNYAALQELQHEGPSGRAPMSAAEATAAAAEALVVTPDAAEAAPRSEALRSVTGGSAKTDSFGGPRSFPLGPAGSLPFKIRTPSKVDRGAPVPVLVGFLNTAEMKQSTVHGELRKGDLIVGVRVPGGGAHRIATLSDFHHAVSPANGVVEGGSVVLRVVRDHRDGSQFIKDWKERLEREQGKAKRGFPDPPKALVSEVELRLGVVDGETEQRLLAEVERMRCPALGDSLKPDVVCDLLYGAPEQSEELVRAAAAAASGGGAAAVAAALAQLAGCSPPPAELVEAALAAARVPGDASLNELWKPVRDAFLSHVFSAQPR